ncbi:tetratricopeptide repeat protein [Rhodopseudomonas sp. BR0M22]|uniref:O-linked N-acetylglucosamine transferase, SPINDLY family protein n=1 Tax=Rhodopseudomonas sp. BR0M22 TaxID=2269369 RepID=UPI0013DE9F8E|nr:tetratricopeptide repeat protein [Rhodopseudomonas sp. BR0M22]NEW90571.1 tetratricopeptide repeat protein [Rhodopseudomonas sp. BR0M22]
MQPGRSKAVPPRSQTDKAYEPVMLLMRARLLHQNGQLDEARSAYKKVLKKAPDNFGALHFYALAEYQSGNIEPAIRSLKRALLIEPNSAQAHSDMSILMLTAGRFAEAIASSDKAIALDPNLALAHANRGLALAALGRYDEAVASYDKAIELVPDRTDSWNDRGNALHKLGRYQDALASYDKAIEIDPLNDAAFMNRASTFKELKEFDLALASYDRALSIGKRPVEAGIFRAETLLAMRNVKDAMATCTAVLKVEPNSVPSLTLLGNCMAALGDAETAIKLHSRALELAPHYEAAISSQIFAMDFSAGSTIEMQQAARKNWWTKVGAPIYRACAVPPVNDRDPDRRLVVGYVSADFRAHSAAFSFRPVLTHHDKQNFEVVCYSGVIIPDDTTSSFMAVADKWRDSSQWPDDRLADAIRQDKVDILVDLSGHSGGNRLRVFARKLAPVQISAWGHATGTGLPVIDYLLGDPVAIPVEDRHFYAETIYDLPSIVIIEPTPDQWRSQELPFDRNGYLTYGSLNRISKMSDEAIAVWAQLLATVPTARLILKDHQIDDPSVRQTLLDKFRTRGIAVDRITLLGSSSRQDHLETLRQVDLCLDPFPQAGGVSTWEALHMGVPVVSRLGTTVPSRVGCAVLAAAGLPDFIATDDTRYIEIASKPDLERLRSIRRGLRDFILQRCGPVAYTRAVEDAYRTMWERWCATPFDEAKDRALRRGR